jgi:hypothetical protein
VIQERIDNADTEEERNRLERFRDGAVGVGRDVFTEVLAKVATSQIPG